MSLNGNQLFPSDNPWNHDISNAPVAANSATLVTSIGASSPLHPDFGSALFAGSLNGIPYNVVSGSQAKVAVKIDAYANQSDPSLVPIPANPVIEGDPLTGTANTSDRHLIIYATDNNIVYELYNTHRPSEESDNAWHADAEAVWNLNVDSFRTPGFTSADAAGLPILPGLARPDEVLTQGAITHALRFTVPHSRNAYVFPASHQAGVANTALPRMGERFRLKQSFNISAYSPADQVILQALKTYGMIVADNGSAWYISGAPSTSWSDSDLHKLTQVLGSSFEAVDLTPVLSLLDQTSSPAAGGVSVTIHGMNFTGDAGQLKVFFGATPAAGFMVTSDTTLIATAPAHAAGTIDVTVVAPYGTSTVSAADHFTFSAPGLVVAGGAGNDVIYLRRTGNNLAEWINAALPGQGAPTHQDSLTGVRSLQIQGGGGTDTIILDESAGDILAIPASVIDPGGSASLELLGTLNPDTITINGDSRSIIFNSHQLTFSDVASITYWDSSANDTIESTGAMPVTMDVVDSDTITIDGGNVLINLINSGATFQPPAAHAAATPPMIAPYGWHGRRQLFWTGCTGWTPERSLILFIL